MTKKKILAISGSTRHKSTNESILKHISQAYNDVLDVEIYDSIAMLPHFNPDLDNENVPPAVIHLRTLISSSDGVIICTPEYVFSLPGALKNALEWTVSTTLFSDKPVAIIVASGLGEKTFESLLLIMTTLQAKIDEAKLLITGARGKFNSAGEITDQTTLQAIEKIVNSFIATINSQNTMA